MNLQNSAPRSLGFGILPLLLQGDCRLALIVLNGSRLSHAPGKQRCRNQSDSQMHNWLHSDFHDTAPWRDSAGATSIICSLWALSTSTGIAVRRGNEH